MPGPEEPRQTEEAPSQQLPPGPRALAPHSLPSRSVEPGSSQFELEESEAQEEDVTFCARVPGAVATRTLQNRVSHSVPQHKGHRPWQLSSGISLLLIKPWDTLPLSPGTLSSSARSCFLPWFLFLPHINGAIQSLFLYGQLASLGMMLPHLLLCASRLLSF